MYRTGTSYKYLLRTGAAQVRCDRSIGCPTAAAARSVLAVGCPSCSGAASRRRLLVRTCLLVLPTYERNHGTTISPSCEDSDVGFAQMSGIRPTPSEREDKQGPTVRHRPFDDDDGRRRPDTRTVLSLGVGVGVLLARLQAANQRRAIPAQHTPHSPPVLHLMVSLVGQEECKCYSVSSRLVSAMCGRGIFLIQDIVR